MLNAVAALRAAKEVQADILAPELYRQSKEWFFKARNEYRLKDFDKARIFIKKSRILAEKAEFEAVKNGGNRVSAPPDPLEEISQEKQPPPTPGEGDSQKQGIFFESYDDHKAELNRQPPPAPDLEGPKVNTPTNPFSIPTSPTVPTTNTDQNNTDTNAQ